MSSPTLLTTPFGFQSTAAEVVEGVDLRDARAIVTGGASGLGLETARALTAAGASVTLAARPGAAAERALELLDGLPGSVELRPLDLADQASVASFCADWSGPLNILVNNAGVMGLPSREVTPEGWEMQLAVNHMGHFALAAGLRGALAAAGDARIVTLSSRGHFRSGIDFADLHFDHRAYDPMVAYGQAKTAVVLFAVEASKRWSGDGITANAVFPGVALDTRLDRHLSPEVVARKLADRNTTVKSVAQAAATPVLAAASPYLAGVGGRYLQDCNEAPVVEDLGPTTVVGVARHAVDPDDARRLWDVCEEQVARASPR